MAPAEPVEMSAQMELGGPGDGSNSEDYETASDDDSEAAAGERESLSPAEAASIYAPPRG